MKRATTIVLITGILVLGAYATASSCSREKPPRKHQHLTLTLCVTVCADPNEGFGEDIECSGYAIALFCVDDRWAWGNDGPCGA